MTVAIGTNAALPAYLATQIGRADAPYVVTADLVAPLGMTSYFASHPERAIDVGIAEQAALAVSAGIAATTGGRVIVALFAPFFLRAFDQIRNLIDLDKRSIVLVATHAGVATGSNGHSHHGVEDIGLMRTLRHATLWSPGDPDEAVATIRGAVDGGGLHYVRLTRNTPDVDAPNPPPMGTGGDEPMFTVLAHGAMTGVARVVVSELDAGGVSAKFIGVNQVHPVPESVLALAYEHRSTLVVIEDHYANCGFAAGLAAELALAGKPRAIRSFGLTAPATSDDADVLWKLAGLVPAQIVQRLVSRE